MRSQLVERLGTLEPQIVRTPPGVVSLAAAEEAIELADAYGVAGGFPLDESQKFTLRTAMGERADRSWAATTVGDFEPRQAGKNETAAARELYGLMTGERLLIHTAHEFPTANESFLRLVAVFEAWDDLRAKVRRVFYGSGAQGITFLSGQRIVYKTRTGGSGRGFAKADLIVYDEAQHLKPEHVAASGPARLANPNSQAWYMGSGGFAWSTNAWRMRRRALTGEGSPRFAYVEHTAERIGEELPTDLLDRELWVRAHPAYGYRVSDESLLGLYDELGPAMFARECLCIWDPEVVGDGRVIPAEVWNAVQDDHAKPVAPMVFGFDVSPDRSVSAIVVADAGSLELIDHRAGVGWAVDRVVELAEHWKALVAIDVSGPAGPFLRALTDKGVEVVEVAGRQFTQACGAFFDQVVERRLRVQYHPDFDAAVAGAVKRQSGDAWAWTRKSSDVDITPLVAATVACWVAGAKPKPRVFAY